MVRTLIIAAAFFVAICLSQHSLWSQTDQSAAKVPETPPSSLDFSSREDVQKYVPTLTLQLRSAIPAERQKAIDNLHQIAEQSPGPMANNLSQWLEPLLENERYEDVLNLTKAAMSVRAADVTDVEKFQEARVRALLAQGKLDQALSEAKAFYNICVLSSTDYAIDLLANVLERQGKSGVAGRLRLEQLAGIEPSQSSRPGKRSKRWVLETQKMS